MATVTGKRALNCPKCRQTLDVGAIEDGQQIHCPHCGANFQAKMKSRGDAEAAATEIEAESFLEWAEDLLVRMICGVYKFIFIKLPTEAYHTVVRWFPTLVRLIKVAFYLAILMASIFLPAVVAMNRQGIIEASGWFVIPVPDWYLAHPAIWDAVAYSYTALALIGSVWGAVYLRRRFKKRKSAAAMAGGNVTK
jgi:DNA-directed RNA polymerase subunit RPC12/RpoP